MLPIALTGCLCDVTFSHRLAHLVRIPIRQGRTSLLIVLACLPSDTFLTLYIRGLSQKVVDFSNNKKSDA